MSFTDNPKDPRLRRGVDTEPVDQNETYLVLPVSERDKGFVRPLFRSYRHNDPECGRVTTMALPLAETYARDPGFYGATYCSGCNMHRPVGKYGEFTWVGEDGSDTSILVGT